LLLLQVAAKLQLVSAFVAAHSAAQEVLEQHLASSSKSKGAHDGSPEGAARDVSGAPAGPAAAATAAAAQPADGANAAAVVAAESRAEVAAAMQYAQAVSAAACVAQLAAPALRKAPSHSCVHAQCLD
jgi:hypothetical protein